MEGSLNERLKAGALTSVVSAKDKKGDEVVTKLRLVGGQPKLAEPQRDPALVAAEGAMDP